MQLPCDAAFGDLKAEFPYEGEFHFRLKIDLEEDFVWQDLIYPHDLLDPTRKDYAHIKAYRLDTPTFQSDVDSPPFNGDSSFPPTGWWCAKETNDQYPTSIINNIQSNFILSGLQNININSILSTSQGILSSSASTIEKYFTSLLPVISQAESDQNMMVNVVDSSHLKLLQFVFDYLILRDTDTRPTSSEEMIRSRYWLKIEFASVSSDFSQLPVLTLKLLEFMIYQHFETISRIIKQQVAKTKHHYPVVSVIKNIQIMLMELYKDSYEGVLILSSACLFRLNQLWTSNTSTTRDDFGRLILQVRKELVVVLAELESGFNVNGMIRSIRRSLFDEYEFQPKSI